MPYLYQNSSSEEEDEEYGLPGSPNMNPRYNRGNGEQPITFPEGSNFQRAQYIAVPHGIPSENGVVHHLLQGSGQYGTRRQAMPHVVQNPSLMNGESQQREGLHGNEQQQIQEHRRTFERQQNRLKVHIDALLETIEDSSRQARGDQPQMMRLSGTNNQLKVSLETLREEIRSPSLQLQLDWDRLGNLETQVKPLTVSTKEIHLRIEREISALREEELRQAIREQLQDLKSDLNQLLVYDREVERTGDHGSPPVDAEELEGKLSEGLEELSQEEKNFQDDIQTNRSERRNLALELSGTTTPPFARVAYAGRLDVYGEELQMGQGQIQQALTDIRQIHQDLKDRNGRVRDMYPNDPLPDMSAANQLHPGHHRSGPQDAHNLAYHDDLRGRYSPSSGIFEQDSDYEDQSTHHHPHRNTYTDSQPASMFTPDDPPPDYRPPATQDAHAFAHHDRLAGQDQQEVDLSEENLDETESIQRQSWDFIPNWSYSYPYAYSLK